MWDEIIKWTGWIIALILFVCEIARFIRNRTRIKFFIGLSAKEGIINLTVINIGHSPVNLNKLELKFPDGYYCSIPQGSDIFYGKLDYMQPKINRLNVKAIKTLIQELVDEGMSRVAPKYIRYVNDKGNDYKVKIPDQIRTELLL